MYVKNGTGLEGEKMNLAIRMGGWNDCNLLVYAAFWLKQHKIPFEWEFCRPLAYDGIVANLPQGSPSSTAIEIPMTAEQQADLCFFATYLHIRLEDWYPGKSVRIQIAVGRIRGFLTSRQLNFPDNWITNVTVTHTFRNRTHSISSHFCIWINVMNMIWKMIKQPGSGIGGQTWHNTKGLVQGECGRDGGGGPLNGSTRHTCGSVLY